MGRVRTLGRASVVGLLAVAALVLVAGPGLAAPKGSGTMLVRQDVHCGGTGNASSVYLPFALYFAGFAPNAVGTVSAYTQPGGHLVATRAVTLDAEGNRCVEVTGSATPGQYKIVYDFGSGTGKQKVIRIVPSPTVSASPSHPIATVSPSGTRPPTATASPSHPIATASPSTATPTASPTGSVTPTATTSSPTTTSASPSGPGTTPPVTTSASATGTASGSPGATAAPTSTPSPSDSETADLELIPEYLPPTGGSVTATLAAGLLLLAFGGLLMLLGRRGSVSTADRRH